MLELHSKSCCYGWRTYIFFGQECGEGLSLIPGVGIFRQCNHCGHNAWQNFHNQLKGYGNAKRTIHYAQTMGVSAGQAMRTTFGEE